MGEKGEVLESVKRSSAAVILSVAAVEESREAACLWLVSSPLAIIRRLLLSSVFKRRRTKKKTPTDTHRQTFFSSKPSSSSPFARQTTKFSSLASFLTLLYIRHVLRHQKSDRHRKLINWVHLLVISNFKIIFERIQGVPAGVVQGTEEQKKADKVSLSTL